MKQLFKPLLLSAALSLTGVAAFSQGMMGSEGHGGPRGGMHSERMEQMAARHLEALKAKLKLTPAQEGAWSSFAAAMKPPAGMMANRPDRAELDKLSTPERVDRMRALRKQHHTEMEAAADKRDEAIKTFYATLTPEQKKTFDAEHARMGQHERGGKGPDQGGTKKPKPADKAPAKP